MMKNKIKLFTAFFLIALTASAQVGINQVSPKAALEITSSILIPRVALISNTDINTVTNPQGGALVNGTMVYNTGTGLLKRAGFYTWINNKWSFLQREEVGDIKYSVQTADHNGWYLLDGRPTSTLTGIAYTNGTALFGVNLPDGRNKSLKQKVGTETLGATVGNTATGLSLIAANLPVINFSGLTNSVAHTHTVSSNAAGNHTHQYADLGFVFNNNGALLGSPMSEGNNPVNKLTNTVSHNHAYSFTTAGSHTHTANTISNAGGTSAPISLKVNKLILNTFVYLGVD